MSRHFRVGVIGAGSIAKAHVIGLRSVSSYFGDDGVAAEVAAIADTNPDSAQAAARRYGIDRWTTDWESLVADDSLDAVTVAVPNDWHAPVAMAAAAAGRNVLCEKPLAHDIEAARAMTAAVEAAGVVHSVNLNYRSIPAIRYARALIEAGELGEILVFRAAFLQEWAANPTVARSWKFVDAHAGAGPVLAVGCHAIDLGHHLVGPVVAVTAATSTHVTRRPLPQGTNTYATVEGDVEMGDVDNPDLGVMLIEFANGATGTVETSRVTRGRKNHCFIEVNGTEGSLVFDYERMNEVHLASRRTSSLGLARVVVGPEQDGGLVWNLGGLGVGFAETVIVHMRDFLSALARDAPASPDFRDGLRAQEVVHAALISARSRRWEQVSGV